MTTDLLDEKWFHFFPYSSIITVAYIFLKSTHSVYERKCVVVYLPIVVIQVVLIDVIKSCLNNKIIILGCSRSPPTVCD